MANWFYYNENGEKIEVIGGQLKDLAKQGVITPGTMIETEDGKTAPARRVKGLTFADTKQPETNIEKPSSTQETFVTATTISTGTVINVNQNREQRFQAICNAIAAGADARIFFRDAIRASDAEIILDFLSVIKTGGLNVGNIEDTNDLSIDPYFGKTLCPVCGASIEYRKNPLLTPELLQEQADVAATPLIGLVGCFLMMTVVLLPLGAILLLWCFYRAASGKSKPQDEQGHFIGFNLYQFLECDKCGCLFRSHWTGKTKIYEPPKIK